MKASAVFSQVAGSLGSIVIWFLRGVARLLSGSRLGRLMYSVSIPRMAEHRVRTSLTVLGIGVGVALLVAVTTVNQSIIRGVSDTIEDISGKADLEIGAGASGFDESVREQVAKVPGVDKSTMTLQQVTTLQDPRARSERLLLVGVDLMDEEEAYFHEDHSSGLEMIRTDPLPFLNGADHVLLGSALAKRFGYKVGDRIPVSTGTGMQKLLVYGLLDDGLGKAFGGAIAVMNYQAMQVLFGRDHNVDRIDLSLRPGANAADVKQRLEALLGSAFTVEQPATKGERIGRMLIGVQAALTLASLIALLVAAFLIQNTMTISVVQRKRELGTLRALGARRTDLQRLVTLEGAALGMTGAGFGVAAGMLLAKVLLLVASTALSETHLQLAATDVHWSLQTIAGSALTGVVFATVASAFAAKRAGRVKPVEAFRTSGSVMVAPLSTAFSRRDLIAILLLGGAALLLGWPALSRFLALAFVAAGLALAAGILLIPRVIQLTQRLSSSSGTLEMHIAQGNLPRDMGRTVGTAAALMVGVAMAAAFATFVYSFTSTLHTWVEQTLHGGDLFITNAASFTGMSSKEVPMADSLHDELLALPGVESVRRLTVIETPYQGYPIKLVSTDADLYAKHSQITTLEGTLEDAVKGWKNGDLTVSENFARRFNVHRGDRIKLGMKHGTKEFLVSAVFVDYTSDIGAVTFDHSTYVKLSGDTRVGTYSIHLLLGADAEAVRSAINQRYGARYDLFVMTNKELRDDISGRVEQIFSLLHALELVALIVATLGIVNALLANILDRVREIGVLRAIGMLRRQISKLIMFEALFIAIIGTSVGVAVGMVVGYVVLNHINIAATGWYFPFKVSLVSTLEVIALTLVTSAAASFYPAREASALKITNALEYE